MRIWYSNMKYSELRYLDMLKTLCSFLDRLSKRGYQLKRHVAFGSWKYHYMEFVGDRQVYEYADKNPLDIMKEIIERANARLY